jgi:hypothetical protein
MAAGHHPGAARGIFNASRAKVFFFADEETAMTMGTILLVVLIILLIGALPTWPHSSGWGYGPTGGVGLLLVILIVLLVLGVI